MAVEDIAAVAVQYNEYAPLAHVAGAGAGLCILGDDVEAGVGEEKVPDIPAELPARPHLQGRHPKALVPDLGGARVVAAGSAPAQVRLMGLAGGPRDELALEENGFEHAQIVDLVSGVVNVVVKDHVAGPDVVPEIFDAGLERGLKGEAKERGVLGLLEHVAVRPVDAGGEIPALREDGRAGGVKEGEGHFLGDRAQPPLEDGGEDGVDAVHAHPRSSLASERKRARISPDLVSGQII